MLNINKDPVSKEAIDRKIFNLNTSLKRIKQQKSPVQRYFMKIVYTALRGFLL